MFQSCQILIIALTQKCNLKCRYCFLGDKKDLENEMSFDTFKKIIDRFVEESYTQKYFYMRAPGALGSILFHGGEPLTLSPSKIEEFAKYARESLDKAGLSRVTLSIQTNGLNLTEDYIRIIKKYNFQIGVSIDSTSENYRYSENECKKIISNIRNVNEQGVVAILTPVVNNLNVNYIYEDMENNFPDNIISAHFCEDVSEEKCSASVEDLKNIYTTEFNRILNTGFDRVRGKLHFERFKILINRYVTNRIAVCSTTQVSTCTIHDCGHGLQLLGFNPSGKLKLCDHLRGDEPDFPLVSDINIVDFLNLHQIRSVLHQIVVEQEAKKDKNCDKCKHYYYCYHGCILSSYKKFGKYTFDDEKCVITDFLSNLIEQNLEKLLDNFCNTGVINLMENRVLSFRDDIFTDPILNKYSYELDSEDNRKILIKKK